MMTRHEARLRTPWALFRTGFAESQEVEENAARMIAARRLLVAPTIGPGMVHIVNGANEDVLEVGGQKVGEVRSQLDGLFNIDPAAMPMIDGEHVVEDHILRHGERLEFLVPFGCKGVGRVWTQAEFCDLFRMTEADFDAMIARGVPVHRMGDGSVRITETDFDRWTECDEPWLFTAHDLAARLHISERELWRMRSSGKLPSPIELGPKLIRWDRSEILDWIEAGCPGQRTWDLLKAKRPKAGKLR